MMGELAEWMAVFVAIATLFINVNQFKKARENDRNEIQKNAAYCVNAWIEVKKEGNNDFYNLYICNNSSGPVRNVKIDLKWDGKDLCAPTKNTYPIIPIGNFVTHLEEKGYFAYLQRVETVQEYSPICIETQTNNYKVLKLEFIDTFSIKWTRNYDLNQSGEEDLIRNNN